MEAVRKMHLTVSRRSVKAGEGIISQKDMALTQFTFMGFHLLYPEKFGIVGSREQFEAFNHFWRVIGFMLGTHDQYNMCGETLEETRRRLETIREDILLPNLEFPSEEYENYIKIATDGMSAIDPTLHYDSSIFLLKHYIQVPNYNVWKIKNDKFKALSFYSKFRVIMNIIIYEYLSKNFVFRWIFNIMRILMATLLKLYPVIALYRFGKKYAYVEIMKPKKF